MRDWIPWRVDEPRSLARYVLPDVVGGYLHLPGPSGDSPVQRLRVVYAAIAGAGIRYANEPPSDQPDSQEIRSPAEVLWAPKHATCLDLAITLAAACLKAGLDPLILLIERGQGTGGRHALVGVWVQEPPDHVQEALQAETGVWSAQPEWLPGLARRTADDAGRPLVVLDPVGVSIALPSSPARGVHAEFGQAVANGAERLFEAGWNCQAGVDVARAWRERETYQPAFQPPVNPLRAPYLDPSSARGPLQLLRADYRIVPFQPRDELTILRHWCIQAESNQQTGLAIIDGVGGSGKTRLALELAQRLYDQGWYAGLLLHSVESSSWSQSVEWLATIVSPILVIVDYADARIEEVKTLIRALTNRTGAAVVVLTARTVEGEWLREIQGFLQRDGQVLTQRRFDLPPEHPDSRAIFRQAAAAFATGHHSGRRSQDAGADVVFAVAERWTTLDYVLLGWLAARGSGEVPSTRRELYEAVLDHEERYWADVYRDMTGTRASSLVLRRAATCLILLSPMPQKAGEALRAVTELASADEWRENVRRTFAECFGGGPGEALALRPDPIADYLAVKVLGDDPDLLDHCLTSLSDRQLAVALANLNRASSTSPEAVTTLFTHWLHRHPGHWRPAFIVASAQAGSVLTALEAMASEQPAVLPLADLAQAIPFEHILLSRLGLAVDSRRLQQLRTSLMADPAELAELLDRVSRRQRHTGDRAAALASSTEAVRHDRALAKDNPTAYLPKLAASLNNLSNRQGEAGDWQGALASITEVVEIRRMQAQANPDAFLPDLAMSLNNLAAAQDVLGNRQAALASITEAVRHFRALAQTNPAAFQYEMAASLYTLAATQVSVGDRQAALTSIIEAVRHFRALAQTNPAAFLPGLATSLVNLSNCQMEAGQRQAALASITEAVEIGRMLAQANPDAFLPGLAISLNNLSNLEGQAGDRYAALASSTEAVEICRTLAQASPDAFLPDLAMSLNSLSSCQGQAGDRQASLASITEAVEIRRMQAQANPDAFLPELAASLNNLAIQQGDSGDQQAALVSITEAVEIRRTLAQASPDAFLPDVALSLNNLAVRQNAAGDRQAALVSITEAVEIRRILAQASPDAFLPDLAASLKPVRSADYCRGLAGGFGLHYRGRRDPPGYWHRRARTRSCPTWPHR